ncbi:unnamed protein product [Pieris macdunnoughi]|uniref:Uncharacterized protein n=1 Tax=Pieris macdunnoughi TaxID=345717 RepID=A0A821NP41_9NEOP|nr:unnamed protein product [Pieris macdunnoughi]
MSKSLTTLQQAVNTVYDLTHIDQAVPYVTSVLEQPIAMFTRNETIDNVPNGEECFELPPIKHLPRDISDNVLESIINEFRDVSSDVEEIRRVKSEELQRKLKLYNSIMEKKYDDELIHSRRSRRRDAGSGGSTPRLMTPVRSRSRSRDVSYTSPCVMNVSIYGNNPDQNDEQLEKQIEEKEKILAKMLNLESLSIKSHDSNVTYEDPIYKPIETKNSKFMVKDVNKTIDDKKEIHDTNKPIDMKTQIKKVDTNVEKPMSKVDKITDLVPKVMQLPNNWNLESIELRLEMKSGVKDGLNLLSPDDHLDSEWEVI